MHIELAEAVRTFAVLAITGFVGLIARSSWRIIDKLEDLAKAFAAHDASDHAKFSSHEKRLDRLEAVPTRR